MESARLIAGLTRVVRDVGLAEELAQDALVAALEQWPRTGIPDNPAAWLMGSAKHRALAALRRGTLVARKHEARAHELEGSLTLDLDAQLDDRVGDDLLRLIFIACHPVLPTEGPSGERGALWPRGPAPSLENDARQSFRTRSVGPPYQPSWAARHLDPSSTLVCARAKRPGTGA
jgi:hypothetical protein